MLPEQLEQVTLFDWIRLQKDIAPYAFHIANERKTTPMQGALLKRMGVRAGVSDIFIGIGRRGYLGMFIEMKAGKNKATVSQLQFQEDMSNQGYYCVVCNGFDEAKAKIEDYLFFV
jgi:hypothetical protein